MAQQNLLTMTEAAEMVGLKRPTFYRKFQELQGSTTEHQGKNMVDVSELIRLFGSDVKLNRNEDEKEVSKTSKTVSADNRDVDATIELAVLRERLKMMEASHKREIELLENQCETLKDSLKKAQDGQNSLTNLIEDKRKKESGGDDWQKTFNEMKKKLANVEAREAQRRKIAAQRKKEKEEAEKNKTIWKKIFG